MMPISLGTSDFYSAPYSRIYYSRDGFNSIKRCICIARSSRLIPDKANSRLSDSLVMVQVVVVLVKVQVGIMYS